MVSVDTFTFILLRDLIQISIRELVGVTHPSHDLIDVFATALPGLLPAN